MNEETKKTAPDSEQENMGGKQKEKKPSSKKNVLNERIAELEQAAEKSEKALKDSEDKFLRLAAEYDNFRKRSFKEKDDIRVSSKTDVVEKLLPIIDNFERAALNGTSELEDYRKGIEMTFRQFSDILSSLGVEAFGAEGDAFDPNLHNAVMHVEDEALGENVIVQVFSKGYKLGEKIIRPATVKVAN